jgi:hypothetical protein
MAPDFADAQSGYTRLQKSAGIAVDLVIAGA